MQSTFKCNWFGSDFSFVHASQFLLFIPDLYSTSQNKQLLTNFQVLVLDKKRWRTDGRTGSPGYGYVYFMALVHRILKKNTFCATPVPTTSAPVTANIQFILMSPEGAWPFWTHQWPPVTQGLAVTPSTFPQIEELQFCGCQNKQRLFLYTV